MPITEQPGSWVLGETNRSTSRVGKDILGWCSRCNMNLMHTIITMAAGSKPDKVLCNTCKTERKFRAPKEDGGESGKRGQASGGKMLDHDEENPLYQEERAKKEIFGEDEEPKRKGKAKPKGKKARSESEGIVPTKGQMIPLSMQRASDEDHVLFDNKLAAMKASHAPTRDYGISQKFAVGEVISHTKFGVGFVVADAGQNKVEVLFKEGRKLLVHSYQK